MLILCQSQCHQSGWVGRLYNGDLSGTLAPAIRQFKKSPTQRLVIQEGSQIPQNCKFWPETKQQMAADCKIAHPGQRLLLVQGRRWGTWSCRPGRQMRTISCKSWPRRWRAPTCPPTCTAGSTSYSVAAAGGARRNRPTTCSTTSPMMTCIIPPSPFHTKLAGIK